MSSGFATIPKTAPFADEEIDAAQSRRRAGERRCSAPGSRASSRASMSAARRSAAQPAAPAQPAEPLTILYASESGNSEKLAGDVAKAARKLGFKPTLVDMADLDLAALAKREAAGRHRRHLGRRRAAGARRCAPTTELMSEAAPRLDGVEFGVLALGDTAYAEFCAIGKAIDERLAALGGKRVADRVDCDLDFAEPAANWIGGALKALAPPDAAPRPR